LCGGRARAGGWGRGRRPPPPPPPPPLHSLTNRCAVRRQQDLSGRYLSWCIFVSGMLYP
jgi:hypothetical protein